MGISNEASSAKGTQSDGELSILDLMTFIWRNRLALLGGATIGSALGLAVTFTLPAQWEATALLRVAQLGGSTPVEPPLRGAVVEPPLRGAVLVEPPLRVVARVTQKSFEDDVLRRVDIPLDEKNPKVILLRDSLKVKVEKPDLVGMRVRGASPDEAARFADAVIAELAGAHAKMAEPTLLRWHSEVREIDIELKRGEHEIERLSGLLERPLGATQTAALSQTMLSNILLSRETELRGFRERKRALQEQLSPERTFPTAAWGVVEVSTQPVFPKKSLFAAAGLMIGMLAGVLLSVLKPAGARRQR